MVRNREEAARAAEATKTNAVGMCQAVTRGYFLAPSVGDFDGDSAADAEDGWKREPAWAKHSDRRPPRGTPVSFLGGSRDNGHRAISLGDGVIRSTDFDSRTKRFRAGVVGNGTIEEVARAMGVTYAGWSETISGVKIPVPPKPEMTRGGKVDEALERLAKAERRAKEGTERDTLLDRSIRVLKRIQPWRKKS